MFVKALVQCAFIFFVLVPAFSKAHGHKAYVKESLVKSFKCEKFPQNDFCSGLNIDVENDTVDSINQNLNRYNETVIQSLRKANISEACLEIIQKTKCLSITRCTPEKLSADLDGFEAECEKGRGVCSPNVFTAVLNCKTIAKDLRNEAETVENPKCKDIQDKSGFCPVVNYKRVEYKGDNATNTFTDLRKYIDDVKPNATTKCYRNMRDAACGSIPACSNDRKYVVVLVSKQECINAFKCLPKELAKKKQIVCDDNPDENTAKTVEAPGNSAGFICGKSQISIYCLVIFLLFVAFK